MTFGEYRAYCRDNPRGLWFKERWYGWGWVPVKWQGWAVIAVFVVVIVVNGILLQPSQGVVSTAGWMRFFGTLIISVSLLFLMCVRKGERPHWNWGDPRKKR